MIDGSGFLQEYMKNKVLEDQVKLLSIHLDISVENRLNNAKNEENLTEEEIDTGLGVGDAILRKRLEQQRMMEQLGL